MSYLKNKVYLETTTAIYDYFICRPKVLNNNGVNKNNEPMPASTKTSVGFNNSPDIVATLRSIQLKIQQMLGGKYLNYKYREIDDTCFLKLSPTMVEANRIPPQDKRLHFNVVITGVFIKDKEQELFLQVKISDFYEEAWHQRNLTHTPSSTGN